jgi:hypothetical protein
MAGFWPVFGIKRSNRPEFVLLASEHVSVRVFAYLLVSHPLIVQTRVYTKFVAGGRSLHVAPSTYQRALVAGLYGLQHYHLTHMVQT